MARCASMISPTDTPARSSWTASASANSRALPLRNTRPASGADLDLDNPLRLQRSQSVAGDDPAHAEASCKVLLGAEKIAGAQLLGEQAPRAPRATMRVERVVPRSATTFRSRTGLMAGCTLMTAFMIKILSLKSSANGDGLLPSHGHPALHAARGPGRGRGQPLRGSHTHIDSPADLADWPIRHSHSRSMFGRCSSPSFTSLRPPAFR